MLRVSIEPATAEYAAVAFWQGESAAEPLAAFDQAGPHGVAGLLADYGPDDMDSLEWSARPPFGTADSCYWIEQKGPAGLVVSIHPGRLYVALTAWRER